MGFVSNCCIAFCLHRTCTVPDATESFAQFDLQSFQIFEIEFNDFLRF